MRKQEALVEEKRARLTGMRKAGLPVKRGGNIPFGVRAIQKGIEVDGIWISRPATPNHPDSPNKVASLATLIALDSSDSGQKAKHLSDDSRTLSVSTLDNTRPGRRRSPSEGPNPHRRPADAESVDSNPSIAPRASPRVSPRTSPRVSQFAAPKPKYPRLASALSEDTLWRLEGQGLGRYAADTYVPTSSTAKYSRGPSQRSSVASSGGESMDSLSKSGGMSARSSSGRSYTSVRSSRLHSSRHVYEPRAGYHAASHMPPDREPYDMPRNRTPISPIPQSETHSPSDSSQELPLPEPTFGPGDLHLNRSSRRVNHGFEILPAGTFGSLQEFGHNGSNDDLEAGEDQSQSSKSSARDGKMPSRSQQQQQPHYSTLHF